MNLEKSCNARHVFLLVNSIPNEKILDWSNFKAFADKKDKFD